MFVKCRIRLAFLPLLAMIFAVGAFSHPQTQAQEVRLYTLDCGHAEFHDMSPFSDTGEYDGKQGATAVPCFLIRHPRGTLLWDTGLGDKLAQNKGGVDNNGIHMSVQVTLAEQLKTLGLAPSDVTYLAFSHFHFDHTGNANLFGSSTWIINRTELSWALSKPTPYGVEPTSFSTYRAAKTKMIDDDYDVFGDGNVRILKAPGHTPGHQVLKIQLRRSGTIILSGDLYLLRENRKYRRVPSFDSSRAETLASIDRIEKIITNTKARLVIQHDPADFKAMPKLPAYLD
jgi:N-acyl homoserine lactone hydrolase